VAYVLLVAQCIECLKKYKVESALHTT